MREDVTFSSNIETRKRYLYGHLQKTYPELEKTFGKEALHHAILINVSETLTIEEDLPENIERLEAHYPQLSLLYTIDPAEYLRLTTPIHIRENINIPANRVYIDHALRDFDALILKVTKMEEEHAFSGVYFLYKTLKCKRLFSLKENRGRDQSKPLRSFCPVGKSVEAIINYVKSQMGN